MMRSVTETLQRLNYHRGRGNIIQIRFDDDTRNSGTVRRRVPTTQHTGFIETRRFRVKGQRVFAFGSSCTRKETM